MQQTSPKHCGGVSAPLSVVRYRASNVLVLLSIVVECLACSGLTTVVLASKTNEAETNYNKQPGLLGPSYRR
jgi:hypothetical protein